MIQDGLKSKELENLQESTLKIPHVEEEACVKIKQLHVLLESDIIKMQPDLQRVKEGLNNKIDQNFSDMLSIFEYKLQNINTELHKFIADKIFTSSDSLSQKLSDTVLELQSLNNKISVLKLQKYILLKGNLIL